jgi:hypothetical protein
MNDIAAKGSAPAAGPQEISASGWWQVLVRTYKESGTDNVSIIAAGVAFYAFLAFVPLLAALVLIYGIVADPASVVQHVRGLTDMMPADAARLIGEQLLNVSQSATSKKGFGLLLAILLSLYGAMRGATSIITALNIVYNVEENRGFVKTTLIAIAITVGAVFAMLLAILGHFGPRLCGAAAAFLLALRSPSAEGRLLDRRGRCDQLHDRAHLSVRTKSQEAEVAMADARIGRGHLALGRSNGWIWFLRRQFRQLQRHLRVPWSRHRFPDVALPHRLHSADGRRAQRRA